MNLTGDVFDAASERVFHFDKRRRQRLVERSTLYWPKHSDYVSSLAVPIFGKPLSVYGDIVCVKRFKVIRSDKHLFKFNLRTLARMLRDLLV